MRKGIILLGLFLIGCSTPKPFPTDDAYSDADVLSIVSASDTIELIFNKAHLAYDYTKPLPDPDPATLPPGHIIIGSYETKHVPERKRVLTSPDDLRAITSLVELKRKEPCECAHIYFMRFFSGRKCVEFGLCPHCFDLAGGSAHEMPKGLFEVFWQHFQEDKKRQNKAMDGTSQ